MEDASDPAAAEAELKQALARSTRKGSAELAWLAEQLPDTLYSEAADKAEAAHGLGTRVADLYSEARAAATAPPPDLPALAAPIEEALSAARAALAAQIEAALQPAPQPLHRFQSALIQHLTALDRTAAAAAETLDRAKDGEPPPAAREILGTLRGGGGGPVFEDDKGDNQQGFSWPEHKDKDGKVDVPAGSSSGKGSTMVITGGGTITSDQGFRLVSGTSKIVITPGGILIDGPVVDVKGKPINLNC
jgi:hypothetical protein